MTPMHMVLIPFGQASRADPNMVTRTWRSTGTRRQFSDTWASTGPAGAWYTKRNATMYDYNGDGKYIARRSLHRMR